MFFQIFPLCQHFVSVSPYLERVLFYRGVNVEGTTFVFCVIWRGGRRYKIPPETNIFSQNMNNVGDTSTQLYFRCSHTFLQCDTGKLYDKDKSNGCEDTNLSLSGMLLVFVERNILIPIFDLNSSTVNEG